MATLDREHWIQGLYDLRLPLGTGISLDELISRAIRDCFVRNNGYVEKEIWDKTIEAVSVKTPQYKKTWEEFKETFEIRVVKGNYFNPYVIID